jgi:cysteine desulfurase/selenocysteine lyase
MKSSVTKLRTDLPFLRDGVYLDSASVSPSPSFVLRKMEAYYRQFPFNYGVGEFRKAKRCKLEVDKARNCISQLIGAQPEEIVFTKNATEAINLVARGLRLGTGDEVIVSELEHQSNLIPWFSLEQEKGIRVRILKAGRQGFIDPASLQEALTERTKLVSITHVSNVLGTIQAVDKIGAILKDHRALFMVDGAQSVGRIPTDVASINCDFFVGCGRKAVMGPQGTGFLYGRRHLLDSLNPLMLGSRSGRVVGPSSYDLEPSPYRFEAGVINTSGFIGLGAACTYFQEVGMQTVQKRIQTLTSVLLDGLRKFQSIQLYGTNLVESQAGILSWNLEGWAPAQVARALDRMGVMVASGTQGSPLAMKALGKDGVVRTSVHYYNTYREILRFLKCVDSLSGRAGR